LTREISLPEMIQKDLTAYYSNPGDTPLLVNPDGSVEEMDLTKFSQTYLCIIVFQAAMEDVSSAELVAFSAAVSEFAELDCQLVGVTRDSIHVIKEWLLDMDPDRPEFQPAKFPCISCQNLGEGDYGLTQALGVPLKDGYPVPSIILTDREDKIRYFASFSPSIRRSVEETLRMVAAIKMVDEAKGTKFAPADWVEGKPCIMNTKAGVQKYFKERYQEEEKKDKEGTLTVTGQRVTFREKFQSFFSNMFGNSNLKGNEEKKMKESIDETVAEEVKTQHEEDIKRSFQSSWNGDGEKKIN